MARRFLLATIFFVVFAQPAHADYRFIVRVNGGIQTVRQICTLLGCTVTRGLDGSLSQLFLVTAPQSISPTLFLLTLQTQNGVLDAEPDAITTIPLGPDTAIPSGLLDSRPVYYFGGNVWNGYANQPAAQVVNLSTARTRFDVSGAGIVAVIDTGVDPDHPALKGVLVMGYDFTRDSPGMPSELADLTQPVSPAVSGVPPAYVNQSTAAVVDQETATVLRPYAAFGHGTMVSGVVHLVAPKAWIMPLKAFTADGAGSMSDVIRAIYYGVQNGAKVLNMSFSTSNYSKELRRALDYAVNNGVIGVGSAGNDGKQILVYPAALDNVMGVASTDYTDQRSSFSNYGQDLVWVAAPGESIISTYPFGTYAAASGTSFSAPFVSGAAALLLDIRPNSDESQAAQAVSNARKLGPELGNGRLDIYQAISALSTAH
jgi:subtilisin family serine protease